MLAKLSFYWFSKPISIAVEMELETHIQQLAYVCVSTLIFAYGTRDNKYVE